jgi:tripartite-type tricarboxylate transporter receptor subunit TctC
LPASAADKLNAAFGKSLQSAALLARFAEQSIEPVGGAAALAGKLLKSDIVLWRQILKPN